MATRFEVNDTVTWGNTFCEVKGTINCGGKRFFVLVTEGGRYWAGKDEGDGNWSLLDEEGEGHADLDGAMAEARAAI